MKRPDPEMALRLYYTQTEINSAEIKMLFSCTGSTATRLKKAVQEEMIARDVRTWLPGNIDVAVAFELWKIDVSDMEKKLVKLHKLRAAGVITDEPT